MGYITADEDMLGELTYPCLATFTHRVDGLSTITVEQNGESFEFLICQSDDMCQLINTDDDTVNYRVAGSNVMCSLKKSFIKDFTHPTEEESHSFNIVKGDNDALVRFEYFKKY